jgi:peptide-methionine (S)-S-oxide reductase
MFHRVFRNFGLAALAVLLGSTMNANPDPSASDKSPSLHQFAYFGGGCFWCIEASLETLPGVIAVVSGYAGGNVSYPTYRQVCSGDTGHAEVVRVEFDPATITYAALLEQFWRIHDPTTLNRQGPDEGPQYRSIILYVDEVQRAAAVQSRLAAQTKLRDRIVTEIVPLEKFYEAEAYHQDYFRKNPDQAYCRAVIAPKLKKLGLR